MSGLVAVIALPGSPAVQQDEIDRLAADYVALRGTADTMETAGVDQARVISFRRAGESAGPSRAAPSWLVAVGTVHPATLWTSHHHDEIRHIDGQFVLVGYDAESGEVLIANDPFGMYSVFVAEQGGRLFISTTSMVLARHLRPKANRLGLQHFLLLGFQFGPATHWDGIRRLEPGTRIVVTGHNIEEAVYWRPAVDHRVQALPMKRAVDHALDAGIATLRSYLTEEDRPWMDLTGGMDSRLMCLMMEAAGAGFRTNTRETRVPRDLEIARRIATEQRWEWCYPGLPNDWPRLLPLRVPEALAWGDGQLEVLQLARVLWAHEQIAGVRASLLSGGGGEHFQFHAWQSEFLNAGRSRQPNIDRWVDLLLLKPVNSTMLAGEPRREVSADLVQRLRQRLDPYRDELNTTQLDALYAYCRTGHFGAYRSADGAHLRAQLPFYFKPIFEAAFSTNFRLRNGHELMKHMVHRLNPAVANIPTTRGGPAIPWKPWRIHRFLPYYAVLGRKAINKIAGPRIGRTVFPAQGAYEWQGASNRAVLAALSSDGVLDHSRMRIHALLEAEPLGRFVASAGAPGAAETIMLGRLITAELALRATSTTLD